MLLRQSPTRRHAVLAANRHRAFIHDCPLKTGDYTSPELETGNSKLDAGPCFTSFWMRSVVRGPLSIVGPRRVSTSCHGQWTTHYRRVLGTKPECPLFSGRSAPRVLPLFPIWIYVVIWSIRLSAFLCFRLLEAGCSQC